MGGRSSDVSYEYQLTNYKLNFNKQTGKQENTTYYWTIRIKCPHCGSTNIYDFKNKNITKKVYDFTI